VMTRTGNAFEYLMSIILSSIFFTFVMRVANQ
jgi:hypothetical protein